MSDAAPTSFQKILVANRGEVARRVMRTARRLGYGTVAVFSTADADARHVREADQAVCIGEALPSESYLRIDRIVDAARASGAQAIHPGYGFLAENAAFAQACRDAGLVFIGPSPEAIRSMGNKAGAKRIMAGSGVPCVPGYDGENQGDARMAEEASRIGFPVMIKASAGGGGRGMRLVPDAAPFPDMLRSARAEASSAFGDPHVILERAIVNPRHIEIQVIGDRHGNAIHLGERDCSVQRRHQKLIEEAPSPAVSPDLRARMGEVAVAATKAIGYEGAGTLEFLLDGTGAFFFMEMNTRLQVEHPVTEAITGLDLVELQIRVARGEPLPLRQEDVTFSGHAMEVRLCAEDPRRDFMPQSGRLSAWVMPHNLRVEEALDAGSEIAPFYDSMIAKVIAEGRTRDEARERLLGGLNHLTALGVATNQFFLARCLAHSAFATGQATTAFLAEYEGDLLNVDPGRQAQDEAVGALLLYLAQDLTDVHRPSSLSPAWPIPLRLETDGITSAVKLTRERDGCFRIAVGGVDHVLFVRTLEAGHLTYECDGVVETVVFVRDGPRVLMQHGVHTSTIRDVSFEPALAGGPAGSDGKVRAAMNGRVTAVSVKVGDVVEAGQQMLTLEAMKMQQAHRAPFSGTVTSVVAIGEQVATDAVVAEIDRTPTAG